MTGCPSQSAVLQEPILQSTVERILADGGHDSPTGLAGNEIDMANVSPCTNSVQETRWDASGSTGTRQKPYRSQKYAESSTMM